MLCVLTLELLLRFRPGGAAKEAAPTEMTTQAAVVAAEKQRAAAPANAETMVRAPTSAEAVAATSAEDLAATEVGG